MMRISGAKVGLAGELAMVSGLEVIDPRQEALQLRDPVLRAGAHDPQHPGQGRPDRVLAALHVRSGQLLDLGERQAELAERSYHRDTPQGIIVKEAVIPRAPSHR